MDRRRFALTLAAALPLACASAAYGQSSTLDGKQFQGVFLEKGKLSGESDRITFTNGRFRSSACDRYGYSDASYSTQVEGDSVRFEAETMSQKYGKLVWKGMVRGDKLDATATMIQAGKAPKEHWVVAGAKH